MKALKMAVISLVLGAGSASAERVQTSAPAALSSPVLGPAGAKYTIVEYSDFECSYCAKGAKTLDAVRELRGADVRVVFKNVPLTKIHAHALSAAQYFLAASIQSPEKAWRLHDLMFANQALIGDSDFFLLAGKRLGLDFSRLKTDANGAAVNDRIAADTAEWKSRGFTGTPIFVVNGFVIRGALPVEAFTAAFAKIDAGATGDEAAGDDAPKPPSPHAWYDEPSKTDAKEAK